MKLNVLTGMCLFTLSVSAQKLDFKFGSEYELTKKATDLSFFGNGKNGFVNLALKDKKLYSIRFDPKTLQKSSEQEIKIEDASKNYNYEETISHGDKVYFLHSDWDDNKEMLYYDEIDLRKGAFTKQNTTLIEASKMAGDWTNRGFYNLKTVNKYRFNYNADSSYMLVSYRLYPEFKSDKKNYDKIGLFVFDKNMKKIWGKEFTMPYTEAIMDNSDFTVDSKGNAYLMAKVYDSDSRKERDKATGQPAYHYELMKFSPDVSKPAITAISNPDHFINSASILPSGDQMMISGTYSNKSKGFGTAGVFVYSLNVDGTVQQYKNGYYPFPKEELQKFESARQKRKIDKKDNYEATNIAVRNLVSTADGGLMIACEEYYVIVTTSTSMNNGFTTTNYTYYYNDIIAAKINSEGNFEWFQKIPKMQRGSRGQGTMGFKLFTDASGYYFLYLDNIHNLELSDDDVPKVHMDGLGGQAMVTKIDKAGKTKKTIAFDTRDESVMIYPAKFASIDNNKFVGRAELKKGIYQPVVITIK